ncbi:MAG: hypothetical protein KBS74_03685 [Clostridiales bacterium]|nr:hypothetical protein [Candidatus Cacconaster stercorequi]
MMTLENVLEWIKTLPTKANYYYAGALLKKKEQSIGVYGLRTAYSREIAVGGAGCTKTLTKGISLLIHWTPSTRLTEAAAQAFYADICAAGRPVIGGYQVNYIELRQNEPIDVGADDDGIQERVIEFIIHYQDSKGEETT